ncbi:amino acid permease [Paludibacterium paludis]|uniref:Arginine/agmatine antiporter n=1 Tax=Paludibacterium paludis TaxID=1225769 RepID=A0A918NZN9_9NEIS|nr:amino acid permease [Paludibacterium paludis]GGY09189.1 amino acid permease [Paludibacterium paludis]
MKRKMGFWMCSALVIGNMIGSGIFLLPSSLAPFGIHSLWGWALATAGSVCLAMMFAFLVRAEPAAGGPYAYTRRAYGDFAAYLCAWCYWKAAWIGNAAVAVTLVGYLKVFVPALANPVAGCLAGVGFIWFFTLVNLMGTRTAGAFGLIMTLLKLVPLVLVGVAGLLHFDAANMQAASAQPAGAMSLANMVFQVAALTMWSFVGLESATVPAEDVVSPEKTIPRATVFGTIFTAVIYIVSVTAIQGMIPAADLAKSSAPFADAAGILFGKTGYLLVAAGAVVACMGTLNGWALLQGQIPMAAARDGLFPHSLARLNRHGVPANGLIASSVLVTLLMAMDFNDNLVGMFNIVALLGTLTALIPYGFCAAAQLQILVDEETPVSAREAKRASATAVLAFLFTLGAIYGAGRDAAFWTFLVLMAGIPMYTWRQWRNRVEARLAAG